jgi:outer membrane receptor for ferric coprogen and ferric-rhodotorulic acid
MTMNPVPSLLRRILLAPICLCVMLPAVRGAEVKLSPGPVGPTAETILLSPFEVVTDRDVGFVPAVSLAGGRMSTSLRDTPLAYSVLTQEFIEALNLTDTEKAMEWAVNSYETRGDGTDRIANLDAGTRTASRGVKPKVLRNFFELGRFGDTYNQDRIDYARGANALLIGNGTLGGALIMLTKQAQLGKPFGNFSVNLQSFAQKRATLDVNQPIGDKLALRFNLLWQDAGNWRERIFDRRQGLYLTTTYRPLSKTKVRLDYETYEQRELVAVSYLADRVSGWDGRTVFAAPTPTLANSNGLGVERVGSDTTEYRIMIPGASESIVMNWANTWRTMGGGQTATTPINGVLPLSAANSGAAGSYMFGVLNEPANRYTLATGNSKFVVPGPQSMIGPDFPTFIQFLDNVSAYVDQQIGENLFLQGAFSSSKTGRRTETMVSALAQIYIDLNRTLPNGQPNPRFLEPYGESSSTAQSNGVDQFDEYRLAAAWVKDHTRLGSFKFNVLGGQTIRSTDNRNKIRVMARNPSLRERGYTDFIGRRYYLTEGWRPFHTPNEVTYVDPVARTNRTYPVQEILNLAAGNVSAKRTFEYAQAAAFAKLFQDRIAILAGGRKDRFRFSTRNQITNPRTSYPADWDGISFVEAPAAPANYWDLSSAARAPYSPPEINQSVSTISYGAVVHLFRGASGFYNFAQTYDTSRAVQELSGALVAPVQSEGWDAGVRFSLLGDRVNVSLATYGSEQIRNISQGPGFLQTLVEANPVGDLSETGRNRRGLEQLPSSYFDYVDRIADGYEVEIVGNVTKNWRLTANLGLPKVKQYNYFTDTWSYIREHETTLRQIALEAGAVIDANNVASTTLPASEARDAASAVAGWNSLQAWKLSNDPNRRTTNTTYKFTTNLYTDYRFAEGRLKGLRVGAGVQYRSKIEIGNRAGDTIVNPANPLVAIDDPAVDVNTPVYMAPWYLVTATLGYQLRVGGNRTVNFDLRVSNLLDFRDPIYNGASLRPQGGDIRSPARVSGGGTHYYFDPRTISFSTRVSF